jgi:adenylyltransferase/sulfurtransferase
MDKQTLKIELKEDSNLLLIDIREQFEHVDGYITELNIPLTEMMARVKELDTSNEIVLYCSTGKRTKALKYMIAKIYSINTIDHLEGGYQSWIESN